MAGSYRIFGSEMSPYSVKVRSYFRYKGLPHRWIVRNASSEADYQRFARIQIIPLVVAPDETVQQDSTLILEAIESQHPDPSIHPIDPIASFISALLEEFGDEWGNKWMFHLRWARDVDQQSAAGRIAYSLIPDGDEEQVAAMAAMIRSRMIDRIWFVGSNPQTAPQIETSFKEGIELLDTHLAVRKYLFGGRPSFADFSLWGQVYEAWTDPTAGAFIEARAHHLLAWVQRMLWPRNEGEFESWKSIEPTLAPFLEQQVGHLFMPWTQANAAAVEAGQAEFTVSLAGQPWSQKPQKYHAKSLAALRQKYAAMRNTTHLDDVLRHTGCLDGLLGGD